MESARGGRGFHSIACLSIIMENECGAAQETEVGQMKVELCSEALQKGRREREKTPTLHVASL